MKQGKRDFLAWNNTSAKERNRNVTSNPKLKEKVGGGWKEPSYQIFSRVGVTCTPWLGKQESKALLKTWESPQKARPMLPLVQCCVPTGGSSRRWCHLGMWAWSKSQVLVLPQHPQSLEMDVRRYVLTHSNSSLLVDTLSINLSNSFLSLLILSASMVSFGGKF